MGGRKCAVTTCKYHRNEDKNIQIHCLPRNEEAKKRWLNAIPDDLLEGNVICSSSIRICTLHFTRDSYVPKITPGETTNILKKTAIPTLFNHDYDAEMGACSVGTHRCRTCLETIDAKQSSVVTRKCYLEKTIKEAIIMLVPEMKSILDGDRVCRPCHRFLKSSLKFIERCWKAEATIVEENKRFEEYDHLKGLFLDLPNDEIEESTEELGVSVNATVNLEHNYYSKDCVGGAPVSILPKTYSKNKESSPYTGSLIYDSLSTSETMEDEYKDDIVIEYCDLLQESKICDNLGPVMFKKNVDYVKQAVTFSCQTCSKEFSPEDYGLHIKIHPPFVCKDCGRGFETDSTYRKHLQTHKGHRRILCDICGKFVAYKLELHKSVHDLNRAYMCHKCPKTFKTKNQYKRHDKQAHKRLNRQQCQVCGLTFYSLGMCRMHYRLVHLELKQFVCKICGKEFGRKDYLQNHMRRQTHNSESKGRMNRYGFKLKNSGKPVTCKLCGKKISSINALRAHLQTHTNIKRFKCKYCNLLLTTAANRDRHEKSHEVHPKYKFRCNICWKRTKTEEELAKHILVHEKRPPKYSCETCGEKFYRKYLLNNHRMNKHITPEDIEKREKEIVVQTLLEYANTE